MPLDLSTAINIGGINCWDEGTSEAFGRWSSSAERTIVCIWEDRVGLAVILQGGTTVSGGVSSTAAPQAYPDAPWLYVETVLSEGIVDSHGLKIGVNGMVGYQWARLRVKYRTLDYNPSDTGAFSLEFGSQSLVTPQSASAFKFLASGNDLPPEDAPAIPVPIVSFVRTRKNLASIPVSAILAATAAPLNSATFEGADPKKIVFEGAYTTRRMTTTGTENWDLTYRFKYRPYEWDKAFNPATGNWETFVTVSGGDPPMASSDLNALFAS